MRPDSARRRFAAALGLYLIWVGALALMSLTTSERPASKPLPSAAVGDPKAPPSPSP